MHTHFLKRLHLGLYPCQQQIKLAISQLLLPIRGIAYLDKKDAFEMLAFVAILVELIVGTAKGKAVASTHSSWPDGVSREALQNIVYVRRFPAQPDIVSGIDVCGRRYDRLDLCTRHCQNTNNLILLSRSLCVFYPIKVQGSLVLHVVQGRRSKGGWAGGAYIPRKRAASAGLGAMQ